MLTAQGCAARRARLWQSLPENVNWALVSDPRHLMYFANYFSDPFVFSSDADAAQLVLGRDGSSVLLTDNIGEAAAKNAFADSVLVARFYDGRHSAALRKALMARFALEQLETRSITGLGIEGGTAPAATILGLMRVLDAGSVFDMDSTIRQLRRAKDPDELDLIRKIMAIAEAGHARALQQVRPGMTELEVYLLVTSA
jgi:Xaa-Pro dipeptidase